MLSATTVWENLFVTESDDASTTRWFGDNVRAAREEKGWRQADVVKAMHGVGWKRYNQATHSRTEEGTRVARLDEAAALAEVLGCRLDDLLLPPEVMSARQALRWGAEQCSKRASMTTAAVTRLLSATAEMERLLGEIAEDDGSDVESVRVKYADELFGVHGQSAVGRAVMLGVMRWVMEGASKEEVLSAAMDWDRRVRLTEEITGLRYVWGKDEP